MDGFSIQQFIEKCNQDGVNIPLTVSAGAGGLGKLIKGPEVNRPGLGLIGFFENFASSRIQIFGRGECAYIEALLSRKQSENLEAFFRYDIACCIYTCGKRVPESIREMADRNTVPVLATELDTTDFIRKIYSILDERFAPGIRVHGVLMEVYGMGVLILGKTSIGKSECALELIERGHRLVADDLVEIRRLAGRILIGRGPSHVPHHMEIRGLGIVNISMLFGVGAIRDKKGIQLVVQLEDWEKGKEYERTGLEEKCYDILGIGVPTVEVPIAPVRNVPVIIEVAAMNQRLKKLGFHAAREFDRKLKQILRNPDALSDEDDSFL